MTTAPDLKEKLVLFVAERTGASAQIIWFKGTLRGDLNDSAAFFDSDNFLPKFHNSDLIFVGKKASLANVQSPVHYIDF